MSSLGSESETNLPSVFETCTPRNDVLAGELVEQQFAASLAEVAHGADAPPAYAEPELFFERTYPTDGLQELLTQLAKRFVADYTGEYSGTNGVIRLDTSFGGGKTHNQIAAYHMAERLDHVPDLNSFLNDEEVTAEYSEMAGNGFDVNTAVFVGAHVDAKSARSDFTDPDAPQTKTMWGEIAYQLFGWEGYDFLREDDEDRSAPGTGKLTRLFERHQNPSLVLIDEIAAYMEQAAAEPVADSTLAKQTNSFLMSLLSATKNTDKVTVVLSIADTAFHDRAEDIRGLVNEAIDEFNNISDRTEGSITPTQDTELAAVLRHRLFKSVDEYAGEAVADDYRSFYRSEEADFPESAVGVKNEEGDKSSLSKSYPIHPTVIDTLTKEIDSLPSFQKTRGALQLLSRGVYRLWNDDEAGERHFVRLFDLHPSDKSVNQTLLRLFGTVDMDFEAAIKADIYDEDGEANAINEDRSWTTKGHPPLGTQLTTTVLWKSIVKGSGGRGTNKKPLRHAVVRKGVELSHYDDALDNLLGEGRNSDCFYLHGGDGSKIQFKSEPNLRKLIDSVVDQLDEGLARRHLEEALDSALGKGPLIINAGPEEPSDIPDSATDPTLCVMDFDTVAVTTPKDIPPMVTRLYENHANRSGGQTTPRIHKNNLVFLVAKGGGIRDAERTAQKVAGIKHIQTNLGDQFELNEKQRDDLEERLHKTKATLEQDIKKAYVHLYHSSSGGLSHKRLTTTNTLHQAVIDKLEEANKIIAEGEGGYADKWFRQTLWNSGSTTMTTQALREQFGKRPDAEILLSPLPLRKTIAKVVTEAGYAYWDDTTSTAYYDPDAGGDGVFTEATNLNSSVDHRDVKIGKDYRVYESISALADAAGLEWQCDDCSETFADPTAYGAHDCTASHECTACGRQFDSGDALDAHDCGESYECDACGDVFDTATALNQHACGYEPTIRTFDTGRKSLNRALSELEADIATVVEQERTEYNGLGSDLVAAVDSIVISIEGEEVWPYISKVSSKLAGSDTFGDRTATDFDYDATDGGESMIQIQYNGDVAGLADHLPHNIEPEGFSSPAGERVADADFNIEYDPDAGDVVSYTDALDGIKELLGMFGDALTVEMQAMVQVQKGGNVGV